MSSSVLRVQSKQDAFVTLDVRERPSSFISMFVNLFIQQLYLLFQCTQDVGPQYQYGRYDPCSQGFLLLLHVLRSISRLFGPSDFSEVSLVDQTHM